MATDVYKGFTNPVSKESFRCLSSSEEAYTMEWIVQTEGYVPFEHIHYFQDEVFHILKGEIRILMDGNESIGKSGDVLTVPKGMRHIAFNNKHEELVCKVEYRPGLDYYTFSQCFGGLILDGDLDKKGQVNIPKMGYFQYKMKAKCITLPTAISLPFYRRSMLMFYVMGKILGWNKLYDKYTGGNK